MPSQELNELDAQLARFVELTEQLAQAAEATVCAFQREFDRQAKLAKETVRPALTEVK